LALEEAAAGQPELLGLAEKEAMEPLVVEAAAAAAALLEEQGDAEEMVTW
jgi:hypothetical protein